VLVDRLKNGLIVSGEAPELDWLTDAVLRVDGKRGFGPVVAVEAIDAIVARAAETGIAMATIGNSNHVGMLAPYVERMAAAGAIGIALTTSEALVHPWNGASAMLGTNPIGIAVPTPTDPLVLDMSTASVSMGKILDFAVKASAIPLGWAVDSDGVPTTDPRKAIDGAISPFGGPKGYALGIAFEAMVAVLSRTAFGPDVKGTLDAEHVASKGDVFIAISVARLGLTDYLPDLEAYLDDVRQSGTDPDSLVTIPGDRARTTREHRRASGIPLHPEIWARVQQLHGEVSHVQ
jgi:LDH2 family malate/lactate/ureidoglycolate dehydrogenase